jgi:hypothetical protein
MSKHRIPPRRGEGFSPASGEVGIVILLYILVKFPGIRRAVPFQEILFFTIL